MEKLSNNLLLLIANLAQQKNKRSIIRLFIQGLNSLLPHIFFSWGEEHIDDKNSIEVSTQKNVYGEIIYTSRAIDDEPLVMAKIQNAAQMLALILEGLEQEQLINDEKSHLEQLVNKRTAELKEQVSEYEALSEKYKDLNERLKELLDKTEKSEEKLRSILENSSNVFYRHDINHNLTYLSPQIEHILGYDPDEAKVNWTELTSDNPMNKIGYELTVKAIETGIQQEPYVLELLHKSGKKVFVEVREVPVVKDGKTEAIVGALVDITERKLMQEKLLKNRYYLKKAQEIGKIGTWELDIQKNILIWTEENYKIFEVPQGAALTAESFFECVHPEDREYVNLNWENALKKEPYEVEHRLFVNNKTKWVRQKAYINFDSDGNAKMAIGFTQDITDVKLDEERIKLQNVELKKNLKQLKQTAEDLKRAKNKAEESDRLKSAFLKNMSHEIRTPMNGIIGFIDLMQNNRITGERRSQYLKMIQKSGDRLLYTINDIIEISKIEAGQMTLHYTHEYLNDILSGMYELFASEAKGKGLDLNLSSDIDDNVAIKTDRIKLESILANLLKNAIKFSSKGEVEFSCRQIKTELQFCVSDNGGGIPEDRLHVIFDRFVQADSEISSQYEGSGLGLSIAKEYVEMFGGKIWAETKLEIGSTFYFTVPYKPVKLKKNEKIREQNNRLTSFLNAKSILIAEDDKASVKLLELLLSPNNVKLIHARNGNEAVEICKKNANIDLILMDLRMPVMDGLEATKQIRKFCKDTPIIAQTAYAMSGDRERAIRAGCSDYISKPIRKEELFRKIQEYLNKN